MCLRFAERRQFLTILNLFEDVLFERVNADFVGRSFIGERISCDGRRVVDGVNISGRDDDVTRIIWRIDDVTSIIEDVAGDCDAV